MQQALLKILEGTDGLGAAPGRAQAPPPGIHPDRHHQHPVHLRRGLRRARQAHRGPHRQARHRLPGRGAPQGPRRRGDPAPRAARGPDQVRADPRVHRSAARGERRLAASTRTRWSSILVEPKNALTRQYERVFALDNVELEFTDDALEAVAEQALLRGTGARGLRAILEEVLLDVMYDLPSRTDVGKCVVDRSVVLDRVAPDPGAARRRAGQVDPHPPRRVLTEPGPEPVGVAGSPVSRVTVRRARRRPGLARRPHRLRVDHAAPPRAAHARPHARPGRAARRPRRTPSRPSTSPAPTARVRPRPWPPSLLVAKGLTRRDLHQPQPAPGQRAPRPQRRADRRRVARRGARPLALLEPLLDERPTRFELLTAAALVVVRRRGGRRRCGRGRAGRHVGLHQRRRTATWPCSPTSATTTPRSSGRPSRASPRDKAGIFEAGEPGRGGGDGPRAGRHRRRARPRRWARPRSGWPGVDFGCDVQPAGGRRAAGRRCGPRAGATRRSWSRCTAPTRASTRPCATGRGRGVLR